VGKLNNDHRDATDPKVLMNIDIIRGAVVLPHLSEIVDAFEDLNAKFPFLRVKNDWAASSEELQHKFYYCCILCNFVFQSASSTYSDVANHLLSYANELNPEHSDQIGQAHVSACVAAADWLFANHADTPIRIVCEVQLIWEPFLFLRKQSHLPYKFWRQVGGAAENAGRDVFPTVDKFFLKDVKAGEVLNDGKLTVQHIQKDTNTATVYNRDANTMQTVKIPTLLRRRSSIDISCGGRENSKEPCLPLQTKRCLSESAAQDVELPDEASSLTLIASEELGSTFLNARMMRHAAMLRQSLSSTAFAVLDLSNLVYLHPPVLAVIADAVACAPSLRTIKATGNGRVGRGLSARAVELLMASMHSSVTCLDVTDAMLHPTAARALGLCLLRSGLQQVTIGDSMSPAHIRPQEIMSSSSSSSSLSFAGAMLRSDGCTVVAAMLENDHSFTLSELVLSSNNVDDSGAEALARALKVNSSLKRLNVFGNDFEDQGGRALSLSIASSTLDSVELGKLRKGSRCTFEGCICTVLHKYRDGRIHL
jgi:hypothetical protein